MGAIDRIRARTMSPRAWIESNLSIRDKQAKVIPFRYKPIQVQLDAAAAAQKAAGKPVRIICLKARQQGASTWTEGRLYEIGRRRPHHSITVIGNERENSEHLYSMYRLFSESESHPLPFARSNVKGLRWAEPHGSQVMVTTAEKRFAGSGHTNQAVHISELAKWPRPRDTMLSLMQSVPGGPGSFVVVESTANGVGNYFHELWLDAMAGRTDWVPVFLPWYQDPDYRLPVGGYPLDAVGDHERYNVYPGQEVELQGLGVDLEQLTWRRWCIDVNCAGDVEQFAQEYPANDIEAFLHSGRPRFQVRQLQAWLNAATDPIGVGSITDSGFEPGDGPLRIWEHPRPGSTYVIGADTSEGLVGGDYSPAVVMERSTRRVVAVWHDQPEPDAFAHHIAALGRYYGTALAAVESNNHGWAVLAELRKCYPLQMIMRRLETGTATVSQGPRLGWATTPTSKPDLIGALAAAIRDDEIIVPDKETIRELMGYLILSGGKTGNGPGEHDDRVMALAIALRAAAYTGTGEYPGYDASRNTSIPSSPVKEVRH
jgi:hypothetical protein